MNALSLAGKAFFGLGQHLARNIQQRDLCIGESFRHQRSKQSCAGAQIENFYRRVARVGDEFNRRTIKIIKTWNILPSCLVVNLGGVVEESFYVHKVLL